MTHAPSRRLSLASLAALALTVAPAPARAMTIFSGLDAVTGPTTARPNSDAAAASFDAAASALGTEHVITFEDDTTGAITAAGLSVAPGVTVTPGADSKGLSVVNTYTKTTGFNTTAGGSDFLEVSAAAGDLAVFTFASPIDAFGAYITDTSSTAGTEVLTFSDGSSERIDIPELSTGVDGESVGFVGFTDPGKQVSSITVRENTGGGDNFGLDDVRYVTVAPEPSEIGILALLALGLGALTLRARRRQTAA